MRELSIGLKCPDWVRDVFRDGLLGVVLSIIPGFAHLIQNRFKEVRWYFLAWLIFLLAGLFSYSTRTGYICIGMAVGLHAGIALQYGIVKELAYIREKILVIILVLLGFTFFYRFAPRVLFPYLSGGYSGVNVPSYEVEAGDYLLAWRIWNHGGMLERGRLVLIHPITLTNHGRRPAYNVEIFGQVIAFGGERLAIENGCFVVNGEVLDRAKYPVPGWLQRRTFSAIIPDNSYFVSSRYNVRAHGVNLTSSHIRRVCVVKAEDIEASAFMRWWPLPKRGFIR
jgi:hypothetical protein